MKLNYKDRKNIIQEVSEIIHNTNLNFMIEAYNPELHITIERITKEYSVLIARKIVNKVIRKIKE